MATDAFGNALGSSLAEQVNDSRAAARINADQMRSGAEDAAADRWAFDKTQREDAQAWADTQAIFAKNRPATYSEGKTRFDVVSDSGMEWSPNNDMAGLGNLQDGDLLAAARKPKLTEEEILLRKKNRLEMNQTSLANPYVKAFLDTTAEAEGGDYNFKYGAVAGKKNDPWRFDDFSTHPGAGFGGSSTAAGRYQITIATWREMGGNMGLTDFSPQAQDLMAVDIMRTDKVLSSLEAGDIQPVLKRESGRWAALPQGKDLPGRYPQPYMKYDDFYKSFMKNVEKYKGSGK
jgi:muramidase (phage lysozyme)